MDLQARALKRFSFVWPFRIWAYRNCCSQKRCGGKTMCSPRYPCTVVGERLWNFAKVLPCTLNSKRQIPGPKPYLSIYLYVWALPESAVEANANPAIMRRAAFPFLYLHIFSLSDILSNSVLSLSPSRLLSRSVFLLHLRLSMSTDLSITISLFVSTLQCYGLFLCRLEHKFLGMPQLHVQFEVAVSQLSQSFITFDEKPWFASLMQARAEECIKLESLFCGGRSTEHSDSISAGKYGQDGQSSTLRLSTSWQRLWGTHRSARFKGVVDVPCLQFAWSSYSLPHPKTFNCQPANPGTLALRFTFACWRNPPLHGFPGSASGAWDGR